MTNKKDLIQEIIDAGKLLWEKDLNGGLNGNISARVDDEAILLTQTKSCLGRLNDDQILEMNLNEEVDQNDGLSTERLMHSEVYKNFKDAHAIIHTHSVHINGYFAAKDSFEPQTFEARFNLGKIKSVEQLTPTVTDVSPIIDELKSNNIVVLKNHGVLAVGKTLFEAFLLIQGLEESIKMDVVRQIYQRGPVVNDFAEEKTQCVKDAVQEEIKKYVLFSKEQIDEIVRLVNEDALLTEMGEKTSMTMDLAVKLNESGQVYSFSFENGKIVNVGNDEESEFLISAPENIWKSVFNREIDPFVATTQKKMHLRGDFAKISRWYAPCSRIFELWQQVPVN